MERLWTPSALHLVLGLALLLSLVLNPMDETAEPADRVDATTVRGKLIMGYQGWFFAPGDGLPLSREHHGWLHWFDRPLDAGGHPTFDLWPATRELTASELYDVPGLTLGEGASSRPAQLFSSRHPETVRRHFRWMREHQLPGVFLQRFLSEVRGDTEMRRRRDQVTALVRRAAQAEGRVWAMMYDVSGVKGEDVELEIMRDWIHLIKDQRILDSPSYLHEDGRPILVIWGFGFSDRGHDPAKLVRLIEWLRTSVEGGLWLMAGTPTNWHSGVDDQDPDEGFLDLWDQFDAISPWAVGRYADLEEADEFDLVRTKQDLEVIAIQDEERADGRKRAYMPVVFPGFSWKNLHDGPLNQIPRLGGDLLYRQLYNAHQSGVEMIYAAMFDEYDEATALAPAETLTSRLPNEWPFLALDADGEELPDDWYLRICSLSSEALRTDTRLPEHLPRRRLENFWNEGRGDGLEDGRSDLAPESSPGYCPAGPSGI